MKKLTTVLLFLTIACSSIKPLTLEQKIDLALASAEWGVKEAYTVEWLTTDDVNKFYNLESSIHSAMTTNPTTILEIAIRTTANFDATLAPDDKLEPYVRALRQVLELINNR